MMHSPRLRPWQRLRLQLPFSLLLVAAAAGAGTAAEEEIAALTATPTPPVPHAALPPSANATCSRSKHVVLASFGEPEEYHTVSLYFASKFPNASVHHLWLHLGNMEKQVEKDTTTESMTRTALHSWQLVKRVAELKKKKTNRRKSSVDWRAFYNSHGIHGSIVDMASLDAYHRLRTTYLHSSVNGYEYELLCFARFIGLHEFCSSKKIDQLTWIDADIPIFDPDFLDRVCLPQGYSVWSLTSGSSFLNTMTCSEIGRFVAYMLDFYSKENRHALVRAIQAHGSSDMASATHIAQQVRQGEPAFAELGIDPKHFSDMFLFGKFLQDTNTVVGVASEEEEGKDGKKEESTTPSNALPRIPRKQPKKAYIHQDENGGTIDPYFVPIISVKNRVPDSQTLCVNERVWKQYYSLNDASFEVNASALANSRLGLLFNEGANTWVPISGAHFQGNDCKARLLSTFSKEIYRGSGIIKRDGGARRDMASMRHDGSRATISRNFLLLHLLNKTGT